MTLNRYGRTSARRRDGLDSERKDELLQRPTYPNGRGERSQADTDDLNVPFRLDYQVSGQDRWLEDLG